jgi:tRNA threonylcarbamoyladenosine biosynthesis protein TsaB
MSEQNILAVDTSTNTLRLALRFGGDRLVKSQDTVEKSHGQILLKRIEELFASAGIKIGDLNAMAVATGPGSFTGLRIGLAAVKGIVMAVEVPIVPVTVFEIAAAKLAGTGQNVHVIVPLNREECIRCVIGAEGEIGEPSVARYDVLASVVGDEAVAGVGVDVRKDFPHLVSRDLSDRVQYDAADLIYLAEARLEAGFSGAEVATLEPLYLQKSQAEIKFERLHKDR